MILLLCGIVMTTTISCGQGSSTNTSVSASPKSELERFTNVLMELGKEGIDMLAIGCKILPQDSKNCTVKNCRFAAELAVEGENGKFALTIGTKRYSVSYPRSKSRNPEISCSVPRPTETCDCKSLRLQINACTSTTTYETSTSRRTDCQQEVAHILGYIVLGLVVGISISTCIFCIFLRRLRLAQQLPNKRPKSDNEDNRINNVVHSALYNEVGEQNPAPAMSRGQSASQSAAASAAKNYEPPLAGSIKDHLYNTIENESTSAGAVNFTMHHKETDATESENVYNHLNENYDPDKTTGNYDHMPSKNEKEDYGVSEGNPKAHITTQLPTEPNGNYFTLEKQHGTNGSIKEMEINNSTSDDYFVLRKLENEPVSDLKL